jgi:hypothetical protein
MNKPIPQIIRDIIDISRARTLRERLQDFAGAAAVFLAPLAFVLWCVAFGWGR